MKIVLASVLLISTVLVARAQTWQFIAPMQHSRAESQAALLPDGRILVAGGYDNSGVTSTCEIYDPKSNTWAATGNMLTARFRFELKTIPGGKVAAFGGLIDRGVGTTGKCEVWDMKTGTWSALPTLPEPRENFPTAYLEDSSVILVGGLNANNTTFLNQCYILDSKTLTFTQIPSMFIGTYSHFGHYVPSIKTFVTGSGDIGGVNGFYLRSTENFDLTTNKWSLGDSLSNPVADGNQHTVQMRDGTIVLPGGRSGMNTTTQDVQVFEPNTKHWYVRGQLQKPHFHCNSFLIGNDSILTIGGVTDPAYATQIVKYCSWYRFKDSSSWAGPDLLEPVQVYSCVKYEFPERGTCGIHEVIYIFGGEAGSKTPMNRCEKLDFGVIRGSGGEAIAHRSTVTGVCGNTVDVPLAIDMGDTNALKALWPSVTSVSEMFSYDSSRVYFNSIVPATGWTLTGANDNGTNVQFTVQKQGAAYASPLDVASARFKVHDSTIGWTTLTLNELTLHTVSDMPVCLSQFEDAFWGILTEPGKCGDSLLAVVMETGSLTGIDGIVPNPASNELQIHGAGLSKENIQVFDMLGRSINVPVSLPSIRTQGQGEQVTVDVHALPAGLYFLRAGRSSTQFEVVR